LSCKHNNEPSIGPGCACVIGSQWRKQEMDRRMKKVGCRQTKTSFVRKLRLNENKIEEE